jgi:hypothetical protein
MSNRRAVLAFAASSGVTAEQLDEVVHDVADEEASRINNAGVPDQVNWLVDTIGASETMEILQNIDKAKG